MGFEQRVADILADVGQGFVHAVDIDRGHEVGWRDEELVVTASVFKIWVLLELVLQASEGALSLTDRIHVPASRRTIGPTGLSQMKDDIDISARDLVFWMMCVSDNTATDVLQELVGTDRVNKRLRDLGFVESTLVDDCYALLAAFIEDLGTSDLRSPSITPDVIARNRALDAAQTNRTTPREMTRLLSMIWRDEIGSGDGMAEIRRILGAQVWPHRLQAGFDDGVTVSGKTGTLLNVRNEAGVVEYPDGGRYAVAVFLRTTRNDPRQLKSDLAIGALARAAVDHLRHAPDTNNPPR